jgi:protein phosphatase
VRENNEDHFMVVRRRRSRTLMMSNLPEGYLPESADDDAYLIIVADGLGGEAFGEMASMLALRTAWDLGTSEIKWTLSVSEKEVEELKEKAEVYFRLIDKALIQQARVKPEVAGMGTTMTAAYTVGANAFVFHVGDSRAYLVREGKLRQLTKDHTVAQKLVDQGALAPEALGASSFRHMLTNCVGCSKAGLNVDVRHARLINGDKLLLCSDGLTDMVDEETIAEILATQGSPDEACRGLVDAALDRGGRDNVTVVLASYKIPGISEASDFGPAAS